MEIFSKGERDFHREQKEFSFPRKKGLLQKKKKKETLAFHILPLSFDLVSCSVFNYPNARLTERSFERSSSPLWNRRNFWNLRLLQVQREISRRGRGIENALNNDRETGPGGFRRMACRFHPLGWMFIFFSVGKWWRWATLPAHSVSWHLNGHGNSMQTTFFQVISRNGGKEARDEVQEKEKRYIYIYYSC